MNIESVYNNRYKIAPKYGSAEYWRNYYNNKTYKQNNGEYSRKY